MEAIGTFLGDGVEFCSSIWPVVSLWLETLTELCV